MALHTNHKIKEVIFYNSDVNNHITWDRKNLTDKYFNNFFR